MKTMQIELLANYHSPDATGNGGDTITVADRKGRELVAADLARALDPVESSDGTQDHANANE